MSNDNAATIEQLNEHPAMRSLRAIREQPNCRYEVEAQLGEETWLPLSADDEYGDMMRLAAEIRDLIFEDGDGTMQGAMIGNPVECLAFAKWGIQRAKGLKPDQEWFAEGEKMSAAPEKYGAKQIAQELTDTALGKAYHGNASTWRETSPC